MGSQTDGGEGFPQLLSGREGGHGLSFHAHQGVGLGPQENSPEKRLLAYESCEALHDLALTPSSASLRAFLLSHPALRTLA